MVSRGDLLEKYGLDLDSAVRELAREGGWSELLDLSARFKSYSFANILLLFSQTSSRGFTPTLVAGYRGWQKLGRQVKKGEKALYIFAPKLKRMARNRDDRRFEADEDELVGFRMVGVFDLSQTSGAELPALPEPRILDAESEEMPVLLSKLESFLTQMGYEVSFESLDAANGFTDFENRRVVVRSDVSSAQRLKTLIHETAHVLLHRRAIISRAQAELEAESCAYVVFRALGMDSSSYSFAYVVRWSAGDLDMVSRVVQSVHGCAGTILDCLGR